MEIVGCAAFARSSSRDLELVSRREAHEPLIMKRAVDCEGKASFRSWTQYCRLLAGEARLFGAVALSPRHVTAQVLFLDLVFLFLTPHVHHQLFCSLQPVQYSPAGKIASQCKRASTQERRSRSYERKTLSKRCWR